MPLYFPERLENNNPNYPIADISDIRGNAITLTNLSQTGSGIPEPKRKTGTIIFVSSTQKYYAFYGTTTGSSDWDNIINWKELALESELGNFLTTGSTGLTQIVSGSLTVQQGITGSVQTASFTPNAFISASYNSGNLQLFRGNSTSSSFVLNSGSFSGSFNGSFIGNLTGTASWAQTALTASFFSGSISNAITALTSSYPIAITGSTIYSYGSNTIGSTTYNNVSPNDNIKFGRHAGATITTQNHSSSIFLGKSAGELSNNVVDSIFIGNQSGRQSTQANTIIGIGFSAGENVSSEYSNYIGYSAGYLSYTSSYSNFIGYEAGAFARSASYSTFIGFRAGTNGLTTNAVGQNNIIIGTGVTLESGRRDSINIGGIIFGTGSHFDIAGFQTGPSGGRIGINVANPQSNFDVSGSVRLRSLISQSAAHIVAYDTSSGQLTYISTASFSGGGSTFPFNGNALISGSLTVTGSVNVLGTGSFTNIVYQNIQVINAVSTGSNTFGDTVDDTQTLIGTTNISGSLQVTGSTILSGSLSVSNGITGSLFGTASWAQSASVAISASFANTASFAETSSFTISSSFATTASFYKETDPVFSSLSASLATTGSNTFSGSQIISGSLNVTQGITGSLLGTASFASTAESANNIRISGVDASLDYYITFVPNTNTPQSLNYSTNGLRYRGNTNTISANFSGSFTGSLLGTASWANQSVSSSYPIALSGTTLYSTGPIPNGSGFSLSNSIFLGTGSGDGASNAIDSNFLGRSAGRLATQAGASNFFGQNAGSVATNAANSNFLGVSAGGSATNARNSNFFGELAGQLASEASHSNFMGYYTGRQAVNASYSNLFGYQVARSTSIGPNNIIIGTNITLGVDRRDSINIGGIIFGTGSYFNTSSVIPFSGSTNGRIGINVVSPEFNLEVSGTVAFPNLQTTGSISNVVLINPTTGQLYYTASSAVGGGSIDTSQFVTNSQTSSFVTNSQTSSFVLNSQTSSFVLNSQTSSFVTNSQTSSFVTNTQTGSFVTNSQTSSFITNSQTSSFVLNSQTGSFVTNNQTASFATTGSNTFIGDQIISASLYLSGASVSNGTGHVLTYDNTTGLVTYTSSAALGGGSAMPGGSTGQIQYNNAGAFAGVSKLTYDGTTLKADGLTVSGSTGLIVSSTLYLSGASINNTGFVLTYDTASGQVHYTSSLGFGGGSSNYAVSSSYPVNVTGSTIYSVLEQSNIGITPVGAVALGFRAGQNSSGANNSVFLGSYAGIDSTNANDSLFALTDSGYLAQNADHSIFIGNNAGSSATNAQYSNFLGYFSGYNAIEANNSFFALQSAGHSATSASNSIFIGRAAGYQAELANHSRILGFRAGQSAISASHSTLLGFQAGYASSAGNTIGRNNIIIGTGISLTAGRRDSINLGAIIFATGSYFNDTEFTSFTGSVGNGRVGINVVNPTFNLDVSGSGRYTNGLTVTGSLFISGTTQSIGNGNVLTYDTTTGQVFFTASSAVGAGSVDTSQFVPNSQTSSFVLNSQTSSFVNNSQTSSFVTNSQTGSFVLNSQTSSFINSSQTSSFVTNSQTSSFVTNNQTASFATTGSNTFRGDQTISGSILFGSSSAISLNDTRLNVTAGAGAFQIYSVPTASYDAVFMEYSVKSGANARAGQFIGIWSGSQVNYTDNSTTDFGNTTVLTFSGSISGGNLLIQGNQSGAGTWTVKSIIRFI